LASFQVLEIGLAQVFGLGGSGKAEGFADGERANHRHAALAAATLSHEILNRNWYCSPS
jgi:hypothetical protein